MGSVVLSIEGAMELLALMGILSSANGNYWHQFPLPYVNYYHIPTVFSRNIMESFAELFEAMGFEDKSSNILEQTTFIKKIVGAFDNLEDLDTSIECSIGGSYNGLALVLDDLSEIIENVGIEKLS